MPFEPFAGGLVVAGRLVADLGFGIGDFTYVAATGEFPEAFIALPKSGWKTLKDAIEAEEKRKPLTDDELTALLKEKGYNIARRTVAKYREQLNIPVARLRKEL